jgi:YfiH family protein
VKSRQASGARPDLSVLRADSLSALPWLLHGFSTRTGGASDSYGGHALNLGYTRHDTHAAVDQNRTLLRNALGAENWPLLRLRQIHSDIIHRIDRRPQTTLAGDGVVTDTPGLLLAVQTADCLPVLLVDAERKAIGAFHAGWRGTLARIVEKGVGAMRLHFGSNAEDIRAAIGPGIGVCCYQIGEEVRQSFQAQFSYGAELFRTAAESDPVREKYPLLFLTARAPGHGPPGEQLYLDLREANRRQLLDAGVPARNISVLDLCTACRTDLFFSHRAEKGVTGRQMGVVGICDL